MKLNYEILWVTIYKAANWIQYVVESLPYKTGLLGVVCEIHMARDIEWLASG